MWNFLIGCLIGFAAVGCICAPLVAPWRVRVRLLVNAQISDPVLGFGPAPGIAMREVTLTAVETDHGHVDLLVRESGTGRAVRSRSLSREACSPSMVAKLDGWSTTRTPLLLVVDELGNTHVYGPDGAVTNLHRTQERIR